VKSVITRGDKYRNILIERLVPLVRKQIVEDRYAPKVESNLPVSSIIPMMNAFNHQIVCQHNPIHSASDPRKAILDRGEDNPPLRKPLARWWSLSSHGNIS